MDKDKLKKFFAEYWEIEPSKVTDSLKIDDTQLNGFTSIKMYQFLASLESKFTVKVKNLNQILTYKDLEKNIG